MSKIKFNKTGATSSAVVEALTTPEYTHAYMNTMPPTPGIVKGLFHLGYFLCRIWTRNT